MKLQITCVVEDDKVGVVQDVVTTKAYTCTVISDHSQRPVNIVLTPLVKP